VRFVFFKHALEWPRASGHDVHTAGMMRALGALGHDVHFVSKIAPSQESVAGLGLASSETLDQIAASLDPASFVPPRLQSKFFDYWGVLPADAAALAAAADRVHADVVVAVGLHAPLYLAAIHDAERVWYAADEWVLHHVSQVDVRRSQTWHNLRDAAVKGVYERAFAHTIDRVWVVSEPDRRAARWLAGIRRVDVIPNGVDADHFLPQNVAEIPETAVFWGRLDFGPNIQALEWFIGEVWPAVRRRHPSALVSVLGFRAAAEVLRLAEAPGVRLVPDLADIRTEICRHQVAIVPMVSGAGIKNKLLEAASLARPILCTPRATLGLTIPGESPLVVRDGLQPWVDAIDELWSRPSRREALGRAGRAWARSAHTWDHAAAIALSALSGDLDRRPREVTA
jgi:glycosyltransferase involved in cell wall biosynthesis